MSGIRHFVLVSLLLASGVGLEALYGSDTVQKTEVGTWFGMAKPAVCNVPGGGCPPVIVMMPEIHGDGTMVATDQNGFLDNHLTGQGNWAKKADNSGIEATFMWLQGTARSPAFAQFTGAIRVRMVGQLVSGNPDQMTGTIEPFFFPFVDSHGNLVLGEDGLPFPDPLGGNGELPECILANGCLGKFEFLVRRIPVR